MDDIVFLTENAKALKTLLGRVEYNLKVNQNKTNKTNFMKFRKTKLRGKHKIKLGEH